MQLNDRLAELLERWEASGRQITPEELCADALDLLEPLRRAIADVRRAEAALNPPLIDTVDARDTHSVTDSATRAGSTPASAPRQIGPYHILGQLGAGGMGEVYKAEQRSPIKRTVAVKIIKLGYDSREVIARFESERQALARMDHPNIARVIDAGVSDTGRPYFVMEYVPGKPITAFCDDNKLSIKERLLLFIQACEAISHAHTKALIHRDIKAANVLAYLHDGKPTVKVIDFGIAKALTGDRLTDATFNTGQGIIVGTYFSMSPEQAEGSQDIDTRTDVYSLGVLLYELLAGAMPFDYDTFAKAADVEIRRIIREVDPPRPSTRLSALGDTAVKIADRRQAKLEHLARDLRRELEWIPLKAMRKERSRRYPSASQLGEDVRNYLEGKPLIAGPESRAYRARKWIARHRVGLGVAAGFAAVVIAAGWGVSSAIERSRELARMEREMNAFLPALERFVGEDLLGRVASLMPEKVDPEFGKAVRASAESLETLFPEAAFRFRHTAAAAFIKLGDLGEVREHVYRAEALLPRLRRPKDAAPQIQLAILKSAVMWREGDPAAIELARSILRDAESKLGPTHPLTLTALNDLAGALKNADREAPLPRRLADLDEAETLYRQTVERRSGSLGQHAVETFESRISLAEVPIARGQAYEGQMRQPRSGDPAATTRSVAQFQEDARGQYQAALDQFLKIEAEIDRALGPNTATAIEARSEVAKLMHRTGRLQQADKQYARLVPEMVRALGPAHWRTREILTSWQVLLKNPNPLSPEQATESLRTVVATHLKAGIVGTSDAVAASELMAASLKRAGRGEDAETWTSWKRAMGSLPPAGTTSKP